MKAAGLAAEIKGLDPEITVELQPSSGGVFEVTYNGDLIFSKKALGRFPEPGEVRQKLGL